MNLQIAKLCIYFHLLFVICVLNSTHFSQIQPVKLGLNNPIESTIKGGETQNFTVSLEADQTARVEIVQNGADVSLAAIDPSGETFIKSESPSGFFGEDLILVTAKEKGEYIVAVTPADPNAKTGKYTILLKEIRPTIPEDLEINKVSGQITKLADEALVLKFKGTIEGKRQALEYLRKVEELSKIKKDKVWEAIAILQGGLIYEQIGEFQNALDAYFKSVEIFRELGNRYYGGSAINNIGAVYMKLGDIEKAISYYTQALKIQREVGNRRSVGIYLNNIGNAHRLLGNYEKAEDFLRQSLVVKREDKSVRGKRSVANTLNNLGTVLIKQNKYEDGIGYMQQGLDLRREVKHNSGIANSFVNLGNAQWDSGKKQEGFENLKQGNLLANKVGDRQLEARSFYLLAVAEKDRGNLTEAIEYIRKGLDLIEQIRGEFVSSEIRYTYFASVQNFYEIYIDLLITRFEETRNKGDVALALQISERSRARSLIELLQEAKVNFKQGIDPNLLEKLKDLQTEINGKHSTRQRILSGKPKPDQVTKVNNEINELNTAIQSLKIKIRREHPKYADLTEGKTITVKEIQGLLDNDTVFLEYKLGEKRSFVWFITKDSLDVYILPQRAEIDRKARDFYNLITTNNKSDKAKQVKVSEELSNILLAPFVSKISKKRLAIIADGVLQYTAFSALQLPNSDKLLADENEIIVLPSASVLAQIRENSDSNKNYNKTIAVFADPVFDKNDPRIVKQKGSSVDLQNSLLKMTLRDFKSGQDLPRLLASRQEAKNITGFLPKDKTRLQTDFAANLENVEKSDLEQYRILHFATHGLLNTSNPEFSGLVFSLYDKNGKSQDGFLTLNNIYNLNLSSDMVVLSACQTALGKEVSGEGLIGISRGFLYAGSNRIVASLWKVDDAATAEFMKRFYRNHLQNKMPASKALQQTKIEMKKIKRYQSPYYWSAFTLLGDWK